MRGVQAAAVGTKKGYTVMNTMADIPAGDTSIVIGVGAMLAMLQIAQLIFRRRGDADPASANTNERLEKLDSKLDAANEKLTVMIDRMDRVNRDLASHVRDMADIRQRLDDKIEVIMDDLRGDAGVKVDIAKIFFELERLGDSVKRLDVRMQGARGMGRKPEEPP